MRITIGTFLPFSLADFGLQPFRRLLRWTNHRIEIKRTLQM